MPDWFAVPNPQKKSPIWHVSDVLIIATLTIVLLTISVGILGFTLGMDFEQSTVNPAEIEGFATWSVFITAISFCLPILFIGLIRKIDWVESGWRPLSPNRIAIDMLIGLAIIPFMGLISIRVAGLLSDEPFENPQLDMILPEGIGTEQMVLLAFLIGIFTPFAEEWLFRGVLHRWLRQYMHFGWGALISSVVFGLFHGILPLIVPTAILGFVCAWAYEKSGSLWSAIIIHTMNNLLQVVALYIAVSGGAPLP